MYKILSSTGKIKMSMPYQNQQTPLKLGVSVRWAMGDGRWQIYYFR